MESYNHGIFIITDGRQSTLFERFQYLGSKLYFRALHCLTRLLVYSKTFFITICSHLFGKMKLPFVDKSIRALMFFKKKMESHDNGKVVLPILFMTRCEMHAVYRQK